MSSPWPGSAGAGVWSLRGSGSPGYQLVPELLEDVGTDELLQSIDARRSNVQEPSPLVPSGVRLQPVSLSQRHSQHRHLFEGEAVGLERHSREIGCAVIHEPDGESQRSEQTVDILRDDLPPGSVEPAVPIP